MTEREPEALAKFMDDIVRNLEKNGFPERRVAFPLERMYEAADAKGLSFNKVLEELGARGIAHEKTPEKVIFVPAEEAAAHPNPFPNLDVGALEGMSPEQMMAAAAAFMQRMSPEEVEAMRGLVENLSDEQKAELLERARKLGLA